MHRYFKTVIAVAAAASLFSFPAYAKTDTTAKEASVSCPIDIVSVTIKNVTREIAKAQEESLTAEAVAVKPQEKKEEIPVPETEAALPAAVAAAETEAAAPAVEYTQYSAQASDAAEAAVSYSEESQSQTSYSEDTDTSASQDVQETAAETVQEETAAPETEAYVEEVPDQEVQQAAAETEQAETAAAVEASADTSSSSYSGEKLNAVNGMVEGPSGTETYYNLNMNGVVSNMQSMGIDGEYWVRDDGVKMYGDYVMAAANLDTHPYGSIVESSLGDAIVVDTGDFAATDSDQLDIAVEW